jgi:uncharacterized protein
MPVAERRVRRQGWVLIWAAHVVLAAGTAALLLVGTIWSVPMALVSRDPRRVGTAMVGVGIVIGALTLRRGLRALSQSRRGVSLVALGVVSLAAVTWTFLASPYSLHQVTFSNPPASLSGTLLLPHGPGPRPAVVFMHGSGPERRGISFHLADRYARAGVTALVYDKRGTGASVGRHPRDPYSDLATDALAAVRHLQGHDAVDPHRIGLWGLSEGGWSAPLAASMAPEEVAFLVIVSGGGASTEDENLYSIRTHLEDRGIGPEGINQALDLRRQIDAYYRTGDGRQALLADLVRAEDSDWFAAADWYLPRASEVYLHGSDEWRTHMEFLDFDALPLLRELDMPMLFLHGALDRSYPATLSAERLAELASDPVRDVQVVTYAGADHAILTRRLPWPRYADGYVEQMVMWVERRFTNP